MGQLTNGQHGALMVTAADLTEGHCTGPVAVGLLDTSCGRGRFANCLGGHTEIGLIHHLIHTVDKPIICYQCHQCFADHQTLYTGISSISN